MKRLLILLMSMVFLSAQPYALAKKNENSIKRGQDAVDFLGETRINEHANRLKMKPEKLKGILLNDSTLGADTSGELLYMDTAPQNLLAPGSEDGTVIDNSIPLTDVFLLHSKPGAEKVIFLDFDGAVVENTAWNYFNNDLPINALAFDLDGDRSTFNNAERRVILEVWQRVAEDYAPFNVDVTTQDPGYDALFKTSTSDTRYGTWVVFEDAGSEWYLSDSGWLGGMAYQNAFSSLSSPVGYYQPAWVFNPNIAKNPKSMAETASHEAGHTLGLIHHNYSGQGTGVTSWAPIMGGSYTSVMSQWSKGEYPDANNTQDDLAIIAGQIPYSVDEHGNVADESSVLAYVDNPRDIRRNLIQQKSIIETTGDEDVFTIWAGVGTVKVNLNTLDVNPTRAATDLERYGTNLDGELTVKDLSGNVIAHSNNAGATTESISFNNPINGKYYVISVKGSGYDGSLDASPGYSNYGSLGSYYLSGSYPKSTKAIPPSVSDYIYTFDGFFAPVANTPRLNTVKAGQAVPIKFNLGTEQSLNVLEPGYPKVASIDCNALPTQALTTGTSAVSETGLKYDIRKAQYTYNWKTDKSWKGTCKQLIVQLNDGQVKAANFKFKKENERDDDREDDRDGGRDRD